MIFCFTGIYLRCATRFFFFYIFIFSIPHLLLLLINVSCTVLYNLIGSHSLSKPKNDNNAGGEEVVVVVVVVVVAAVGE